MLNILESLAVKMGAAVAYGAHFSKGNQAGKESIDRISGSGVYARDADSLVMMTKHEEDGAFTIEPTLRNFAPVKAFVMRWNFPLMEEARELDPAKLKKVPGTFEPKYSVAQLVEVLAADSFSFGQMVNRAKEQCGMSKATVG
jgi:hypothetical protein